MIEPFIKAIKYSKNTEELLKRRPTALVLLLLIALRARRTMDSNFDDLKIGEAFIGDYENYGASLQSYRTDKQILEKYKFATFRSTNRGTIAKLMDKSIFDINEEKPTNKLTDSQQAANKQLTTNKNSNNVKEGKEIEIFPLRKKMAEVFLKYFNLKLKTKPHLLTAKIIELYSNFVQDDSELKNHQILIDAVDNVFSHSFWKGKVDVFLFFKDLEKWRALEPDSGTQSNDSQWGETL